MHGSTHLRPESRCLATPISSEFDISGSGILEHDAQVGGVPDLLGTLDIADSTIVAFPTDNGPMAAWYSDGGAIPFLGHKATTREGGVRVRPLIRWPGRIEPGSVSNGIRAIEDLFTKVAAAAAAGEVVTKLRQEAGVCIDEVDSLAHWTEGAPSSRTWNIYDHVRDRTSLHSDPSEDHGSRQAGDFAMMMGYASDGRVRDFFCGHLATFEDCPPRRAGGSLLVEMR